MYVIRTLLILLCCIIMSSGILSAQEYSDKQDFTYLASEWEAKEIQEEKIYLAPYEKASFTSFHSYDENMEAWGGRTLKDILAMSLGVHKSQVEVDPEYDGKRFNIIYNNPKMTADNRGAMIAAAIAQELGMDFSVDRESRAIYELSSLDGEQASEMQRKLQSAHSSGKSVFEGKVEFRNSPISEIAQFLGKEMLDAPVFLEMDENRRYDLHLPKSIGEEALKSLLASSYELKLERVERELPIYRLQ